MHSLSQPDRHARLIESILLGIPVPPIFVAENPNGTFEVIDGLQRLTALRGFIDNKLKLTGLEFVEGMEGQKFSDMDMSLQRRLFSSSLTLLSVPSDSTHWGPQICNIIFDRVNAGVPLNSVERSFGLDHTGNLAQVTQRMIPDLVAHLGVGTTSKRGHPRALAVHILAGLLSKAVPGSGNGLALECLGEPLTNSEGVQEAVRRHVASLDREGLDALAQEGTIAISKIRWLFGPYSLRGILGSSTPSSRLAHSPAYMQAYLTTLEVKATPERYRWAWCEALRAFGPHNNGFSKHQITQTVQAALGFLEK